MYIYKGNGVKPRKAEFTTCVMVLEGHRVTEKFAKAVELSINVGQKELQPFADLGRGAKYFINKFSCIAFTTGSTIDTYLIVT